MDYGVYDLILIGFISIVLGFLAIAGMVRVELGPQSQLRRKRFIFLILALGTGVFALALKLFFIIGFINIKPVPVIKEFKTNSLTEHSIVPPQYRWVNLQDNRYFSNDNALTSQYKWAALPESIPSPEYNPTTPEKVALGKTLFNDPLLSNDQTVSCATCHNINTLAGADGLSTSKGINGRVGNRNSPTIWNTAFQTHFFWDGRAHSLEEQAKEPLLNPNEMGMTSFQEVEMRVNNNDAYRLAFAESFGEDTPITIDRIVEAIAAYERTLVTADTPYDHFIQGDLTAMTTQQIRGMALFESMGCVHCHHGPNFSAASVFNSTAPFRVFPAIPTPLEENFELLEIKKDSGQKTRSAWRVPSLRNVALTGPWLHNGSITQLEDVVRIMASSQLGLSGHYLEWSEQTKMVKEINRAIPTDQQVEDMVAFLHALSSNRLRISHETR